MYNNYRFIYCIFIKLLLYFSILSYLNVNQIINNNNIINESLYENNIDFSNLNSNYKIIAIYYLNNNDNFNYNKTFQNINNSFLIDEQIKLAKNHGIFGFGIMHDFSNIYQLNDKTLNMISYINEFNFPFFIIINNNININHNKSFLIKNLKNDKENYFLYLDNMQKYFISDNYIKYKGEPILGIFNSPLISRYLIKNIREYFLLKNSEKIFIIFISNKKQNMKYINSTIINYPSLEIGLGNNLNQIYSYNYYYYNLFKEEINKNANFKSFQIVNGSPPKKFYFTFKTYLNQIYNDNETFILFNSWNDYKTNLFLEPNAEYGFAYLNYFSKAIFNLETNIIYDLKSLKNKSKIAVQVHLFYQDLIEDIINKTNNIPVLFDLYITITNPNLYKNVEIYIKQFSKTNHYELLLVDNVGRDIIPFLTQMRNNYKQYKYICHIHTKKSLTSPKIGLSWRNYLYNNLLGNINITSEILNDFEKNEKLGFIFPDTFFGIIKNFFILTKKTKYWMDVLSAKLFPKLSLGKLLDFPAGNMFWAKTKAIYQIFILDLSEYFPKENNQTNDTIMHGIERIWLYLVKFNFFKYKIIFYMF